MPWLVWTVLGVLALIGESISMALFLLYVGVSALVAAVLSFFNVAPAAQFGVFIVLSLLLIVLVRPRMLQALSGRVSAYTLTNQGPMVNRMATVTQTVTAGGGTIRVGNAEFWTARANPPVQRIDVGSQVRIAYVDGLTAYVESISNGTPLAPGGEEISEMAREEK